MSEALIVTARLHADSRSIIGVLLEAGADVHTKDGSGHTALISAVEGNFYPDVNVISLLLEAGADVNAQDISGRTALMYAVERNRHPDVIFALLEAGADISLQNDSGKRITDYPAGRKALDEYRQRRSIEN